MKFLNKFFKKLDQGFTRLLKRVLHFFRSGQSEQKERISMDNHTILLKSGKNDLLRCTRFSTGFTMVELLVSMSVFLVLVSVSSGIFIKSLKTQKATISFIAANSNASLAIEQIAREVRTSSGFSGGGSSITFVNAKNETVTYRWNNSVGVMALERSADGINFKRITADNVSLENLNFLIFNGSPSDPYPWRITIVFKVAPKNKLIEGASVNLQTTVSSRVL